MNIEIVYLIVCSAWIIWAIYDLIINPNKLKLKDYEIIKNKAIQQERDRCLKMCEKWFNRNDVCAGKPTCCIEECDLCFDCFDKLKQQINSKVTTQNKEVKQ